MAGNEEALAAALGEAIGGDAPAPKPAAPAPAPVAPPETAVTETTEEAEAVAREALGEPAEEVEVEGEAEEGGEEDVAGPEYIIEVDGEPQVVAGEAQIRELLQKGASYTKNAQEVARTRDALTAQARAMQEQAKFHAEIFNDVTQLRTIDAQLQRFQQVDMAAEFERDPFAAMKLKEQRDQWREARNAVAQQIQAKEAQFREGQAQAARTMEQAERAALVTKLPHWASSEKASAEQAKISKALSGYGFNDAEIAGVLDHRYVLVARDAMLYRELQAGKGERLKQVRSAPPVVKPGASASPVAQSAVKFKEATKTLRALGRKGDHRAQEALAAKMLDRAFK